MNFRLTLPIVLLIKTMAISGFSSSALGQQDFVESGFINDYSILSEDPERPNVRLYKAPGASLDEYGKVFLTDVVVFLHPQSEYQGISVNRMSAVAGEFQRYVEENLGKRRELVSEIIPGEKTVVVRLAISNVYAVKPTRGVLGYTPIGVVGTGVKKAAGNNYRLATAAFEAELVDGETGEILAALVATQLGETLAKVKTGERKWSDIQNYLRGYADTLGSNFN